MEVAPALPNARILPRENPAARKPAAYSERHPVSQRSTPATIERDEADQAYVILVDDKRAGLAAYRDHGEQRVFYHTEVDESFTGRGLAGRLVACALDDVRTAGKRIVAVCPYVAAFLTRHTEFADLVDPVTPELRRWLAQQLR